MKNSSTKVGEQSLFPRPRQKKFFTLITQPHLKLSQTIFFGSFLANILSFVFSVHFNKTIYFGRLGHLYHLHFA